MVVGVQEYSPDWMREQYIEHYYEYVNYTRNQQWDLSSIHHRSYLKYNYINPFVHLANQWRP